MAVNRLLYVGLLIIAAAFYFASSLWISWLLLVMLLALPILSLLFSLPAMLSVKLDASLVDTVEQGEKASLRLFLRANNVLPLPEVQIRLNLRTRDQAKDMRYLSRLSRADGVLALSTEVCGFLAPEFRRGWVFDALGLFRIPMRTPKLVPMAILPPARQPDPLPRLEQFLQQQMKPKPGGGYSETHDNRNYRPGDPVKDIHWKLSLKTENLVVREPLEPVKRRVILALRTPRGPEIRALSLGYFRWISCWLLDSGVPHEAVWMEGTTLQSRPIRVREDAIHALRSACLAPEDTADLPWPLPLQADWICPVGPEGGSSS